MYSENLERLTEKFRKLGATHPTELAKYQLEHSSNLLGQFIILKTLWGFNKKENVKAFVEDMYKSAHEGNLHPAMKEKMKVLSLNEERVEALTELIYWSQKNLLAEVCWMLSGEMHVSELDETYYLNTEFIVNTEDQKDLEGELPGLLESFWDMEPGTGYEVT